MMGLDRTASDMLEAPRQKMIMMTMLMSRCGVIEFLDFSISQAGVELTYLVSLTLSDSSANLDGNDDNDYVDDDNDCDRVHGLLR